MRGVIGVAWHSPFVLREWLKPWLAGLPEARRARFITQFLGWGAEEIKEGALLIFVPSMSVFQNRRAELEETDAVVILFDSFIVLKQANVQTIDAITRDNIRFIRQELTEATFIEHLRGALNHGYHVEIEEFDLVPNLINNAAGTLTEALLNLTARCRVPEKRRQITQVYTEWLMSSATLDRLEQVLRALDVDPGGIAYAIQWLQTKNGAAARGICTKIAALQRDKKNVNYEKLCKGSSVTPYDIRYLLRYARSSSVERVDQTSVEAFQGRARSRDAANADETLNLQEGILNDEIDEGIEIDTDLDLSSLEEVNY